MHARCTHQETDDTAQRVRDVIDEGLTPWTSSATAGKSKRPRASSAQPVLKLLERGIGRYFYWGTNERVLLSLVACIARSLWWRHSSLDPSRSVSKTKNFCPLNAVEISLHLTAAWKAEHRTIILLLPLRTKGLPPFRRRYFDGRCYLTWYMALANEKILTMAALEVRRGKEKNVKQFNDISHSLLKNTSRRH